MDLLTTAAFAVFIALIAKVSPAKAACKKKNRKTDKDKIDNTEAGESSGVITKEVTELNAQSRVGAVLLSWELDDTDVDYLEVWGKYCNDQDFWLYGGYHKMTRALELKLDPLAAVELTVKLKFTDGTMSRGNTIDTIALHRNVVFDEYKGRAMLIYLPDSYHNNRNHKYPVIYMHDGQNLFSPRLAFVEEWCVDEAMDRLTAAGKVQDLVVVGIYNSSKRGEEYTPFADRRFGGGNAREFSDFVVKEIIPYIESRYRVSDRREDRAVMGSSFGGILSLWMGYTYPDVFSMVGAISPSLWIADGQMLMELENQPKKDIKIWIDQGTGEWSDFTRNTVDILMDKGYEYGRDLIYYEVKGAQHNEVAWSQRVECPIIFFKGKPAGQCTGMRVDIQNLKHYSLGPLRTLINPIGFFDNGIWYSLYSSAEYSIDGGSRANIDNRGILEFNGSRFAHIRVKYDGFEESLMIKNPEPEKKALPKIFGEPGNDENGSLEVPDFEESGFIPNEDLVDGDTEIVENNDIDYIGDEEDEESYEHYKEVINKAFEKRYGVKQDVFDPRSDFRNLKPVGKPEKKSRKKHGEKAKPAVKRTGKENAGENRP